MNYTDTAAAKKTQYHTGFTRAQEDAIELEFNSILISLRIGKAERLASRNRHKGVVGAAHYYEGRADGFRQALQIKRTS